MLWSLLTSGLALKLGFFHAAWYEVGIELGLDGTTSFVVTLVLIGAGLTLLRLPMQLVGLLGPRVALLLWPVLVWMGLACWVVPGVLHRPVLTLGVGGVLALAGAAARYASTHYPEGFRKALLAGKGLLVPLIGIVAGFADGPLSVFLLPAAVAVLVGLPVRFGWMLLGRVPVERFDAKMADMGWFRRAGMSDDV